MTNQSHQNVALYDDPGLYKASSVIRQRVDAKWVLDLLPERRYQSCFDIGCGNGDLLGQLVAMGRVSNRVMGIDRSAEMVAAARRRMASVKDDINLRLEQADALSPPEIEEDFELVTMLAVLHWLYPHEARVFPWLAGLLAGEGVFCMTTYHPPVDSRSRGGSDNIVLEAMERIGVKAEFPDDFMPIGLRTRPEDELEQLLGASFRIEEVHTRSAATRVDEPKQASYYHVATFGTYYTQLLPAELRPRLIEAIGEVAMDNMKRQGHVTSMDIKLWICHPLESAQ